MRQGTILIPTYRRPAGLAKLLAHIERLETSAQVTVLVADNDCHSRDGTQVVERIAPAYRFPIRCIGVAERGVVHVRNALIAAALAVRDTEFIAFIDDDEWPEPQWLDALMATQVQTGADVVGGTMLPCFPGPPPAWAETLAIYRQEQADGPAPMIWGSCNVLITRACLENMTSPWFDAEFGSTGGEDVEFFTRAKAQGCVFAWARAARVFEDVPLKRVTLDWVMRRSFRIGNTNARTQLRWRYRRFGHGIILGKSILRLFWAALGALRNPRRAGQTTEAMCLAARSFGEIAALCGVRYKEYG